MYSHFAETPQERARRAGELAAHAETLSPRLLTVTSGVYQPDDRGNPVLVGSAILVELGEARFLLTAGHVLDFRRTGALTVGLSPKPIGVSGDVTRLSSADRATTGHDRIDIGIVRLSGEAWHDAPQDAFASWAEIDMQPPILATHAFGLLGFPHSQNRKPIRNDRMIGTAYRLISLECDESVYQATGNNPEPTLLVGFSRKEMWDERGQQTAPALYGVSGSGLWRYGRRIRDATAPPRLSAVAVEWHPKGRHQYILGTRIRVIICAMCEKYSDVRQFVAEHTHQET